MALRYVALGDSYTIGTGVRPPERWPDQLCAALGDEPALELVANLGVNGYTSADLIRHELPALEALGPEFATVLIGVNDVVQGIPTARYEANVAVILERSSSACPPTGSSPSRSPDYTVTPAGADTAIRASATTRSWPPTPSWPARRVRAGSRWVDIFDLSRRAADDRSLVAERRAPPERSPVRPVGRADRPGRRGPPRALTARLRSSGRAPGNEAPRSLDRAAAR